MVFLGLSWCVLEHGELAIVLTPPVTDYVQNHMCLLPHDLKPSVKGLMLVPDRKLWSLHLRCLMHLIYCLKEWTFRSVRRHVHRAPVLFQLEVQVEVQFRIC